MRRHALLAATSVLVLAHAPMVRAATSISTATTTPVSTSTAGDTTVTSDGTITVASGTAITLDSDNLLSFNGVIDMTESESGSTGILITDVPNRTQDLTITGDIAVTDDFDAEDTNDDDVIDAPFAEGTGRYGIRSTGNSPFTGNVEVTSDSVITINGNESYGIRFENAVDGNFTYDGATTVYGNNSTALALDKGVTGNVYLSGSASVWGANSSAITLNGPIGGSLIIDGSYTGTGYATTSSLDSDTLAGLDPALNLLQAGPLVSISGNVTNGILFGSAVTSTVDDNTDEDGDGLTDTTQSTASLTQYGGAPALRIASADQDITIGGLTYGSTAIEPPTVNYGLLVRGSIASYGLFSGVDTNAVQLGGLSHRVDIANGIGIAGSVSSTAYGANTTALVLNDGVATPRLDVTGSIGATTTTATTVDDDDVYTTVGGGTTARAVSIASGASLPTITIGEGATIYATAVGSTANATAIEDHSNTLTAITNSGTLSASITASDDDGDDTADTITGKAIAIDTRSNTVGLTLTQTDTAPDDDDIAAPYIYGRILLGSGDDTVTSSGGVIYGDLDFGAGAGTFTLSDGATYTGNLTSSGPVTMEVTGASTAALLSGTEVSLSSLHVDGDSTLGLTLETANSTSPILTSTGAITFDDGATLNLGLDRLITDPQSFKVLNAGSISLGDIETSTRDGYIPYLYHADLTLNDAATELSANFRLKTQEEAGYSNNQYAALMPVLTVMGTDTAAQASLLSETDKAGFDSVFNQYLPDYSGEALLSLSLGSQSLNRSLSALTLIPANGGGQYWLQEYGYYTKRDSGDTAGFTSTTFSLSGGRETAFTPSQTVGVYASMTAASPYDSFAISSEGMSASDLTAGGYWRLNRSGIKAWAHAGVGFVQLHSIRNLLTNYVTYESEADWSGYSVSAGAGLSYDIKAGRLAVTPEVLADYYRLSESKHSETGGGDTFDLTVAERDSHMFTTTARLRASYDLGLAKPEIWLGYRQNVSVKLADTIANFTGGDAFTLNAGSVEGGGPVVGFRVSQDGQYSHIGIEAQYEKLETYENASIALRTRFQF